MVYCFPQCLAVKSFEISTSLARLFNVGSNFIVCCITYDFNLSLTCSPVLSTLTHNRLIHHIVHMISNGWVRIRQNFAVVSVATTLAPRDVATIVNQLVSYLFLINYFKYYFFTTKKHFEKVSGLYKFLLFSETKPNSFCPRTFDTMRDMY